MYLKTKDRKSFFIIGMIIFLPIALIILSTQYGATWDERLSIKYSNDLLKYFLSLGNDKTCLDTTIHGYNHLVYYGNIFGLLSTALGKALPFPILIIRHILCSFFGFITIFYAYKISVEIGDVKLGGLTVLLLLLFPRFFGHIMNDFRDTTFMMGYIMSIYYSIKLIKHLPSFSLVAFLMLSISIFFSCSVRVGGIIIYIFLILSFFARYLGLEKDKVSLKLIIGSLLGVFIISYSLLVLIWPWTHDAILSKPFRALQEFSDLDLILNYQLFEGRLLPNRNIPLNYLFTWIGITTPILILLGLIFGVFILLKNIARLTIEKWVLLIALIVPLLAYIIGRPNLYDSWRHFLFLAPMITIISAYGWLSLLLLSNHKIFRLSIITGFISLMIFPLKSMIKNHPLQTTYFNEITGGIEGAIGNYELDIDGNSVRSASEWLNEYLNDNNTGNSHLTIGTNNDPLSVSAYLTNKNLADNVKWIQSDQLYNTHWDYAIITSRTMSKAQIRNEKWPFKESIHQIRSEGIPIVSILKRNNNYILEGAKLINKGSYDAAINKLQLAVEANPYIESAHRYLGLAKLYSGDLKSADLHFQKARRINPNNSSLLYYSALLEYNKKNYSKAMNYIEKSKQYRLDNYNADYLKAQILTNTDQLDLADELYTSILKSGYHNDPEKSLIYNGYGELYFERAKRSNGKCKECIDSAIVMFERSVNRNHKNINPYLNLIELYQMSGKREFAEYTIKLMEKNTGSK